MKTFTPRTLLAAMLIPVLASCSDKANEVVSPDLRTQMTGEEGPANWQIHVCKIGPEGTTANFEANATSGTMKVSNPFQVTSGLLGAPPSCKLAWEGAAGTAVTFNVTELASAGLVLDTIRFNRNVPGASFTGTTATITEEYLGHADVKGFAVITYKNSAAALEPSLTVEKTAASATVPAGSPIGFSMTVNSNGPGTATGVTLTDLLPGGAGINWTTASAECSITGAPPAQTLNCAFGDLAAGENRTVSVTSSTTLGVTPCAEYHNVATVGATNHGTVASNPAKVTVTSCESKLRLTKTAANGTVNVGQNMVFTMTVYSDGPATANNVTLTDPLPTGVGIVWSTSSAGCSIIGNVLSCNFGNLAAGQTRTVTVTGTTSANSVCAAYTNTATASASNHAPITATATVNVTGCTTGGIAGCTPGYWKQKQHFGSWLGYTPTGATASKYNAVFGVNLFSANTTLLQALGTGGGGIYRFGRHSTAALLNAANPGVDYGYTVAGVISAVQQAVATGNLSIIDKLADEFEKRNERGCTLGRAD